tara:strand:+ start:1863 stop:2198 length:336 start_codon:yes stop_codon:yes gene_type:complete
VSNYINDQQIEEIVDKVIKRVWEKVATWGMVVIFAFVLVSLELNKSRADESITPTEFKEAIVEVPGKVSEFAKSEWEKTKEYQAKSWADMKSQFASTKNKLSGFFSNLNLD